MNRANKEIRDQFEFFTELLSEEKIIENKSIQLQPKKSNAYWLTGKSNVLHSTITEDVYLLIERSKRDSKYGLKLRCSALSEEPFFRFDSDGPAHRNDDPNIPLEDQSVSTPHFNSYQSNGKPIAYKNEALKKEKDAEAVSNDINFGISLFCMETKCKLNNGDFPNALDKAPEIDFQENPTINFEHINFD